jgi:hypothetical protein
MRVFKMISELLRRNAIDIAGFELEELENLFVLMLFGSSVGVPLAPAPLSLELLPYLDHEIGIMNERAFDLDDMLCRIAALLSPA